MTAELRQAARLAMQGWFSPLLAVAEASRALAGTDLVHHHRFLREAEDLRYAFVQGLNRVHAEQLAYADDIRRSSDPAAERRTRVDAATWQLLDRFRFEPDPATARIAQAGPQWQMLGLWCAVLALLLFRAGGRLRP
jgi:ABC-2 type transport system permease protein